MEIIDSLNLKTIIQISNEKYDFELFSINKGLIESIKLNDDVFELNNGTNITNANNINNKNKIQDFHVNNNVKNNVNVTNNIANKVVKKRTNYNIGTSLFPESELLCQKNEYGNISLYKPILEYILKMVPKNFQRKHLCDCIYNFYVENNKKLSKSSAQVYSCSYRKYMLDHNLIIQQNDDDFVKVEDENNTTGITNGITSDDSPLVKLELSKKKRDPDSCRGTIPKLIQWIADKNIKQFDIETFFRDYPSQRKHVKRVEKLLSRLICENKIIQIKKNSFKVAV